MIVVIEDEVFSSPLTPSLQLVSVLRLGFDGWHRVQTDPPFGTHGADAVHRWLDRQETQLRDEAQLAFESGLEDDAHGIPSDHLVKIAVVDSPDWESVPPRLPIGVAGPLLQRPLRLVLENRRYDRAFLESVSFEPWRTRLRDAFSEGRLRPTHGGGLTEMKQRVEEFYQDPGERLRHWVVFDSDAREPGRPSQDSEQLRELCQSSGLGHHQLKRRASENYLPQQAIHAWAHQATGNLRTERRRKAETFSEMEPTQRHHFNMKRGFEGDRREGEEIPDFFGDWAAKPELATGFGRNIARLFLDLEFQEDWLLRDGQKDETMTLIQAIFRAL